MLPRSKGWKEAGSRKHGVKGTRETTNQIVPASFFLSDAAQRKYSANQRGGFVLIRGERKFEETNRLLSKCFVPPFMQNWSSVRKEHCFHP